MSAAVSIPRLVIAGPSSGVGKTTAAAALARALVARGVRVAPFKCGPDYLDPGYLSRAARRPCHTLDGWMMGRDAVLATLQAAADGADLALIEGMMGLFDGTTPTSDEGSTAELARWLEAPVLLVVDAAAQARSIAALALGFAAFDPALRIAGVIANRVAGDGHAVLLRDALASRPALPPLLGALPSRPALAFPERHLGLRTAGEADLPEARLDEWAAACAAAVDLDAVRACAAAAPPLLLPAPPAAGAAPSVARCRIGVARDEAFHFYYPDNLRRLEALGAQLVPFSPMSDAAVPPVEGLYLGGGYPELFAAALAANHAMRASVARFARTGGIVYAECGGLMYLSEAIVTLDGRYHPMVGLCPGQAVMRDRLVALGYVEVQTLRPSPLGPAGVRMRGHQFRYSELAGAPGAEAAVYAVRPRWGGAPHVDGFGGSTLLASYVHVHWASAPAAAAALVDACAARAPLVDRILGK